VDTADLRFKAAIAFYPAASRADVTVMFKDQISAEEFGIVCPRNAPREGFVRLCCGNWSRSQGFIAMFVRSLTDRSVLATRSSFILMVLGVLSADVVSVRLSGHEINSCCNGERAHSVDIIYYILF